MNFKKNEKRSSRNRNACSRAHAGPHGRVQKKKCCRTRRACLARQRRTERACLLQLRGSLPPLAAAGYGGGWAREARIRQVSWQSASGQWLTTAPSPIEPPIRVAASRVRPNTASFWGLTGSAFSQAHVRAPTRGKRIRRGVPALDSHCGPCTGWQCTDCTGLQGTGPGTSSRCG
jgi:hypothetical protein